MYRKRSVALVGIALLLSGCGSLSHPAPKHPRHHTAPTPVVIPASAGLSPIHYTHAADSKWKALSDQVGFPVLYPQEGAHARLIRASVTPSNTSTVMLQFNNFIIQESSSRLPAVVGTVKTTGAVAIAIPKAGVPYPITGTWNLVEVQGHAYPYLEFTVRGIHVRMAPSGPASAVTLTQLSWIAETLTNHGS